MNIYSRKSKCSIIGLVVLFAVVQGARLPAAATITVNPSHTITEDTSPTSQNISFTGNNAILTVKHAATYTNAEWKEIPNNPRDITWTGTVTMSSSGTFQIDNYTGPYFDSALPIKDGTVPMTFTLNGSSSLTGSGGLTKTGEGTFVLATSNTSGFIGSVTIEAGTFEIRGNGALSGNNAVILGGGVLEIGSADNNQTIASLSGNGRVRIGGKTLTVNSKDDKDNTIIKDISFDGTGTFEKTGGGSLVVSNNISSFGGTVKVSNGSTLSGTGILNKVVIGGGANPAALAPGTGADIGESITISDLTIENGGLLKLRVDSENYDYIKGLTKAVINGTIEIDAAAGTYNGQEYKIFQDNGGKGKAFDFSGVGSIAPTNTNFDFKQKFLTGTWVNNVLTIRHKDNYFSEEIFTDLGTTPNLTPNQTQVATALDKVSSVGPWKAMTQISDSKDPDLIRDAYNQMSGDLRANSMMLGQWQTSRYGLNHLDLTNCGTSQGNGVWLEIIHQTTDFDSDGNSGNYGISRSGFLIGSEERRIDTMFGFFVGYSYPFLYDHGDKVEVGDLQFGFYGGSKVAEVLETKLFVGYGHQGYKSKRFINNPLLVDQDALNWDPRINGKYDGDSMSMSLEFAVPWSSGFFCLRPVAALDSDLTWQYGFAETGDTGLELWHNRSFLDRSFVRGGLTMQLGSVDRCDTLALLGRAYYGHQVFGDPYPVSRSQFLGEDYRMTIHGVNPGKDYVDLGIGLRWNIDAHRSFYGDYDFNAFSRSTAHWGTFGFMQRW